MVLTDAAPWSYKENNSSRSGKGYRISHSSLDELVSFHLVSPKSNAFTAFSWLTIRVDYPGFGIQKKDDGRYKHLHFS